MERYILILCLLFLVQACDNCDEDVNYFLTDFEKGLIPFLEETTNEFISQDSHNIDGLYDGKKTEIINQAAGDDGTCNATNTEREFTEFRIPSPEINLNIGVRRTRRNDFIFVMNLSENNNFRYSVSECDGIVENVENLTQDITAQGFQFTNVYVFSPCFEDSSVTRILYSAENGIELIEFADDTFLRLDL